MSSSLEDYLEAIVNLGQLTQVVRSKDIAGRIGVSKSSVTSALKILSEKGLVNYKPYGYVTLTEKGKARAQQVVKRHNIIKSFFEDILGVDKKLSAQAACKAEHSLGPEIISHLASFTDFIDNKKRNGDDLIKQFSKYYKKNSVKI